MKLLQSQQQALRKIMTTYSRMSLEEHTDCLWPTIERASRGEDLTPTEHEHIVAAIDARDLGRSVSPREEEQDVY
jgi:hypothetical protein